MGKALKTAIIGISMILLIFGCASTRGEIDTSTVSDVDLDRYLGTWYEIARYDNSFEKGLVGSTANYSWREDGKIAVVNRGYKGSLDGEIEEAIGKAKIPNPEEPGKLKVSFFWIFYGDYFIMELDENYQWAVIGSSTDKYLWILSRTPQMNDEIYQSLLANLTERGYDTSKLLKVPQPE